ncbi:MAG: circadian clock protein KaiC [Chloroflexota bacterium]
MTFHPQSAKSEMKKMPTGIEGFDVMTGGGLPCSRMSLLLGSPGAGKTVFALQTLVNGARQLDEPGIFIAFEEDSKRLIENVRTFGWDLGALEDRKLFFLDAHLPADTIQAGQFDLIGLLAAIEAKAKEIGAKRVVFDSIDALLIPLNDPLLERQEILRVHDWFAKTELTGIMTAKDGSSIGAQRYGFMQFITDCVVTIKHQTIDRVSLRTIQIMKYRGSSFAENEFPMVITPFGIDVASIKPNELDYPVSTERISTGVQRLDTMLNGGYYRGSSTLVSGAPGTAKTTLSGAFVEAACQRGEPALYVSFDEAANEVIRNMASVGIDLKTHVDSGLLRMYSAQSVTHSAAEHLVILKSLIAQHRIQCLAIDPLSALLKSGDLPSTLGAVERLLRFAKSSGITIVCTSLLEGVDLEAENTPLQVSTIADTWIQLSYVIQAGERNRALTIIKSRGTQHSNQVRELILSDQGVTLTDVYTAGGEVLMGTLRHEKEQAAQLELVQLEADFELERRAIEVDEGEISSRIETLRRELDSKRTAFRVKERLHEARETQWRAGQDDLQHLRYADSDSLTAPYPQSEGSED